jgi:hypothetical protein
MQSAPLEDGGFDAGFDGGIGCASPTGQLTVSPQSIDFGSVVVKSVASQNVTIANCTVADVTVTPILTGPQASSFTADRTSPFTVRGGQSITVMASYSPLAPSEGDDADLQLFFSSGGAAVVALQGVGLQSGLRITPIPLNFAFVQLGNSVTELLHLSNVGNERITVLSAGIVDPGSPAAYTIATGSWTSGDLTPGETEDIKVTFAPTIATEYTGELDIQSSDTSNLVPVALTGLGGGAVISCSPLALDFETVATNISTTLPVICTNTGSDVPNHPEAGVILGTLISDNAVYAAQVDPGSINPASKAQPLGAGQSVEIDVIYTPVEAANDVGTLKINSNATDGTSLAPPTVTMTGNAILEAPCAYAMTPSTVQFGAVRPGTSEPSGFTITNLGPNECLVTGLDLSASTQNVFTLLSGPIISQRLSAPGTAGQYPTFLQVNVDFQPEQTGNYSGAVQFTISDPNAPHQSVSLAGSGGNSCFTVKPQQLRFGTVGMNNGQFCATETSQIVGVNACAQPVTIQSATIAGSSAFDLISSQLPQMVDIGGTSTPLTIGFKPPAAGTFDADVLLQTDLQTTAFGAGISGTAVSGSTTTDKFTGRAPQLDVLWIMDTDDSANERNIVASQAPTYIDALSRTSLDYQIGVTSDDWCSDGVQGTSENGRLLPCPGCKIDGQQPTIITAQDPNAGADLQYLMEIGANTGASISNACTPDEQFFNAAYEATVATSNQVWNAQLIRPDAYLAIITVNGDNTDDNSLVQTPQWFASELLSIKGADNPGLFSWSYINPSGLGSTGGHQSFTGLPDRIQTMLNSVGSVAVDTTQANWTKAVTDLWNNVLASSTRFPLSGTPDPSSIAVYLDGPPPGETAPGQTAGVQIFATDTTGSSNWSYDAATNTLQINDSNLTLSGADTLYVEYTLACP